jgi:hypothetical protein
MTKNHVESYFCAARLHWGFSVDGVVDPSSLQYFSEAEAVIAARRKYPDADVMFYRDCGHSQHAKIEEVAHDIWNAVK